MTILIIIQVFVSIITITSLSSGSCEPYLEIYLVIDLVMSFCAIINIEMEQLKSKFKMELMAMHIVEQFYIMEHELLESALK